MVLGIRERTGRSVTPKTDKTSVQVCKKMCLVQAIFFKRKRTSFEKKHGKNKKLVSVQKWGFERRGEGSYGIQSQEGQELTDVAAAAPLTTQKSSESHIVDVANKSMVNRYLRVFHHVLHFMVYNRTSCWTCMSE